MTSPQLPSHPERPPAQSGGPAPDAGYGQQGGTGGHAQPPGLGPEPYAPSPYAPPGYGPSGYGAPADARPAYGPPSYVPLGYGPPAYVPPGYGRQPPGVPPFSGPGYGPPPQRRRSSFSFDLGRLGPGEWAVAGGTVLFAVLASLPWFYYGADYFGITLTGFDSGLVETAFVFFVLASLWALVPALTDARLSFSPHWITAGLAGFGLLLAVFGWLDSLSAGFSVWALLGAVVAAAIALSAVLSPRLSSGGGRSGVTTPEPQAAAQALGGQSPAPQPGTGSSWAAGASRPYGAPGQGPAAAPGTTGSAHPEDAEQGGTASRAGSDETGRAFPPGAS